MYLYLELRNYKRTGMEKVIFLNPLFSKEQIKKLLLSEQVDSLFVNEIDNAIYIDELVTFKAGCGGMDVEIVRGENFALEYEKIKLKPKDKFVFSPEGSYDSKFHYGIEDLLFDIHMKFARMRIIISKKCGLFV